MGTCGPGAHVANTGRCSPRAFIGSQNLPELLLDGRANRVPILRLWGSGADGRFRQPEVKRSAVGLRGL